MIPSVFHHLLQFYYVFLLVSNNASQFSAVESSSFNSVSSKLHILQSKYFIALYFNLQKVVLMVSAGCGSDFGKILLVSTPVTWQYYRCGV